MIWGLMNAGAPGAMNSLSPFQPKRDAPLTGGARFIRGFTRIGAVVAVLVAVIGLAITYGIVNEGYSREVSVQRNAQCIARLSRAGYVFKLKYPSIDSRTLDYDVNGCSDYGLYGKSVGEIIAIADSPAPTFMTSEAASALGMGLIITGICAILAYVLFWVIGWVFAGFTRDA
ncbi:hypothetical protein ACNJX9_11250 [Bradyrhizobium sp. DASA03076]|uniref:hypothetical protein n=1 Tax=Bradyrhizobium sp. BLXBL-03 TaxID=3395916 RepID=UPI003F71E5E8